MQLVSLWNKSSVTDTVLWMKHYRECCPHLPSLQRLQTALDNPTLGTEICKLFKAREPREFLEVLEKDVFGQFVLRNGILYFQDFVNVL